MALADAMQADLVIKRDLDEAFAGLEARFVGLDAKIEKVNAELRAEFKVELAKLQVSMMQWVFAMVGGATVLQIAPTFLHRG